MKWKKLLKGIMPIASKVIGTANPLAGYALRKASEALLGTADGTEQEIEVALKGATVKQIAELRNADNAFELELEENNIKLEEIHAEDRASAREMMTETGSHTQDILAGLFVGGYFVILYMLVSGEVKITDENQAIVLILIGIMSASVTQIMNFYFGSSKGSKEKTKALRNITK